MKKITTPRLTTPVGDMTFRLWKEKFVAEERLGKPLLESRRGNTKFIRYMTDRAELHFGKLVELGHPGVSLITLTSRRLMYPASVEEILKDLGGRKRFRPVTFGTTYDLMLGQGSSHSTGTLHVNGRSNIFPMVIDAKGTVRIVDLSMMIMGGCIDAWSVDSPTVDADMKTGDRIFLISNEK